MIFPDITFFICRFSMDALITILIFIFHLFFFVGVFSHFFLWFECVAIQLKQTYAHMLGFPLVLNQTQIRNQDKRNFEKQNY